MKNVNLEYEADINGTYLKMQLENEAELDKISYLVLQQDCPEFVVPVKKSVSNGSVVLRYQINSNWTALKYSMESSVTKEQFIILLQSLIQPLLKGREWFLKINNYVFNPENVYVEKGSENLHFIYIPVAESVNSIDDIFKFIKQFTRSMEITDDSRFQIAWMRLCEDENLNLKSIDEFLTAERNKLAPVSEQKAKEKVTAPKTEPVQAKPVEVAPVAEPVAKPKVEEVKPTKTEPVQNDAFAALFGDDKPEKKKLFQKEPKKKAPKEKVVKEKKGLFAKKKEEAPVAPVQEQKVQPVTLVAPVEVAPVQSPITNETERIRPDILSNDTFVFDESFAVASKYLQLVSSPIEGAPERISLDFDKPFLTIGRVSKDAPIPDVAFTSAFKGIGRKHAIIEQEGGNFYLIDQGSSNRTLLNGEQLIPNKKYLLQHDDVISFTVMMPVKYRVCLN